MKFLCAGYLADEMLPKCRREMVHGGTGAASSSCISHRLTLPPKVNRLPKTGVPSLIKIQGMHDYEQGEKLRHVFTNC